MTTNPIDPHPTNPIVNPVPENPSAHLWQQDEMGRWLRVGWFPDGFVEVRSGRWEHEAA